MKPWSHLPNAPLIDWVLESSSTDPEKWDAALKSARPATLNAALNVVWYPALDAARLAGRLAGYDAAWNAAYNAVRVVILALVAYDDCDEYLQMSYEQLLTYAMLSERPQAVLLLPLK